MAALARVAAMQALQVCKKQSAEIFLQQTRRMGGGGGGGVFHVSYNGKKPPAALRGDDFITYGGLTLPKFKKDYDYWCAKVLGSTFWFTMFYHLYINWDEHYYGDIWVMERDVQLNGWDDEEGHTAHH